MAMTTTLDALESVSAQIVAAAEDGDTVPVEGRWPIGTVVALHYVAHRCGPEPDPPDVIEAVKLDLIRPDGGVARYRARGGDPRRARLALTRPTGTQGLDPHELGSGAEELRFLRKVLVPGTVLIV
jgi:hypothetical protein